PGGGAHRPKDPERDLLRKDRRGGDRGLVLGIDRRLRQNVDWLLLVPAFGLVVISTVTLASLHVGRAGGSVVVRQIVWFAVGLVIMVFLASLDTRRLVRAAPAIYVLGLGGLASVFVLGRTVSGARPSVVWGPLSVQPSELFKVCFLLIMVWALTSRWAQPGGQLTLAMMLPIVAVPVVLIIKQPDLGTALLLVPVLVILLIRAGLRLPPPPAPAPLSPPAPP